MNKKKSDNEERPSYQEFLSYEKKIKLIAIEELSYYFSYQTENKANCLEIKVFLFCWDSVFTVT